MNTERQITNLVDYLRRKPRTVKVIRPQIEKLTKLWIKEHSQPGGRHRSHAKRHPKHKRGFPNRPLVDSMGTAPGNARQSRAQV